MLFILDWKMTLLTFLYNIPIFALIMIPLGHYAKRYHINNQNVTSAVC